MAALVIQNISDELQNAIRLWASAHGNSIEAEARDMLEASLKAAPGLGSLLAGVGRQLNLTGEEIATIDSARGAASGQAVELE